MIKAQGLTFGYGIAPGESVPRNSGLPQNDSTPIFQDFGWTANRGDSWAVLGPSGCGKTTLLYLLAGLRRPGAGTLLIDDRPVAPGRLQTGLILQDHGLLPWATTAENVGLGLKIRGVPKAQRTKLVGQWLDRLGLSQMAHRYPSQLSGGQRQRIAIARALILEPDLLLMDEPFASLDALTREEHQDLLLRLTETASVRPTTVLVTHDVSEAVILAKRIMVLSHPPNFAPTMIDNPESGRPGFREDPLFYGRSQEVRHAVGRARGASALAAEIALTAEATG